MLADLSEDVRESGIRRTTSPVQWADKQGTEIEAQVRSDGLGHVEVCFTLERQSC